MIDEKRDEMIREARVFYQAAPLVIPIIQKRKGYAHDMLMSAFRDGASDLTTKVAELYALDQLEREILQKSKEYQTLEEKSRGNTTNRE